MWADLFPPGVCGDRRREVRSRLGSPPRAQKHRGRPPDKGRRSPVGPDLWGYTIRDLPAANFFLQMLFVYIIKIDFGGLGGGRSKTFGTHPVESAISVG